VLVPPVSLKLDLDAPLQASRAELKVRPAGESKPTPSSSRSAHPSRPWEQRPVSADRRGGPSGPPKPAATASWWTARATAGEVKPGFNKQEILRKPEADPRAEGGIFSRLEGLLRALSV
jgi:hypothetical protein